MRSGDKWNPIVIDFNEHGATERPTAYGMLCTRSLRVYHDIRGPDSDHVTLAQMHNRLLDKWGFDLDDLIEIEVRPDARTLTFYQKWWDRSKRKPEE